MVRANVKLFTDKKINQTFKAKSVSSVRRRNVIISLSMINRTKNGMFIKLLLFNGKLPIAVECKHLL